MNTEWERFSFSSPAIPRAHQGKGLSRPRVTKLRKQSSISTKPSPFLGMEQALQERVIEDLDVLSIQGTCSGIHYLEEDLSNLDINALRDRPFEFEGTLNDDMKNLNIKKPVDTRKNPVSSGNANPNDCNISLYGDTSLNEEMKKMHIKESTDLFKEMEKMNIRDSVGSDSEAFHDVKMNSIRNCPFRETDAKESEIGEIDLNEEMRNLHVKENAGTVNEGTLFRDIDAKLKLNAEERTPNRFVFTGSQSTKVDKSTHDESATSKLTRAKLKKKGLKQKVHLWSGLDFPSSETKSENGFSPMDISPSTASDNREFEHTVAPCVETTPVFTFGANQSPQRSQGKKYQPSVEIQVDECEKWRLKGNLAYKSGDLVAAEEFYKEGINSVPVEESSRSCLRALALCYSNLAATHMSLGRLRDALRDCQEAASIDPTFYKVHLRSATCHLLMGQVEEATGYFRKCLSGSDICVDRKIAVEASDGLQKVEKFMKLSAEAGDESDREVALEAASDALLISPYCEKMLETKALLLFTMGKYDAVATFSQSSLDSAEKNCPLSDSSHRNWRFRLAFLSYFHLGKLEDALSLNESRKYGTIDGPISSLISTAEDLLRFKEEGNEAMQAGKPMEAIEQYTSALSLSTESRPFAAICFFNRAAAHKSVGNVIDAIADCNLAIALDGNYAKALSRRATLYEMIRDYNDAASDLRRVLSSSSDGTRLAWIEEEARKDVPLDLYMILGISTSASSAEIKKAYRKAALRHHPDKAGQVLARSDETVWREIGDEVREDAEKLFKRIGEAYAVLCDPVKRSQYDLDEEIRNFGTNRSAPFRKDVWRSYA